jgi:5-methyltetrahydropteroyltriglutamate--homocysteine methyltransferase
MANSRKLWRNAPHGDIPARLRNGVEARAGSASRAGSGSKDKALMKIRTTHIGSLPEPKGFNADGSASDSELRAAVAWVVDKQRAIGLDVINEGELTKGGDWLAYLDGRFAGFEQRAAATRKPLILQGADRKQFADFYRYASDKQTLFYAEDGRMKASRPHWVCTGPITYRAQDALRREIDVFKSAVGGNTQDCFITTTAPASLEPYRGNEYYETDEAFVFALADALRVEYEEIARAGFAVQIDDAWLLALWDRIGIPMGLERYKKHCAMRIDALNHALANVPEESVRYHLCWGSWHGPHAFDLPMKDVVDLMLRVKAKTYLFEAANARHEHEHVVWESVTLPDGKVIVPGCVTHSTDVVEHPELVAQRIERYARLVGAENVMAGADCGFGGRCHPQIAWAKLESLARGAALARVR